MGTRYFALIMHDNPSPVLNMDGLTMAVWDTYEEAKKETSSMPIAAVREIRIFDINSA